MNTYELQKVVEEISLEVFQKPFRHQVSFNTRLRATGGRYLLQTHNIEISAKHYQKFGYRELEGIIKHELCHYHLHLEGRGYKHGDADFKALIKATDTPRYCSTLEIKEKRYRLLYQCASCGCIFKRMRAMNTWKYRCGKCQGKLVLISEQKAQTRTTTKKKKVKKDQQKTRKTAV